MTASESIWRSPRVAVAVIVVLLFVAWRLERMVAARRMQDFKGQATRALTEVLSHANSMGGPITIEGDAPGAPRQASISLTRGSGADSTHAVAAIGLLEVQAADTVGGWTGLCVGGASTVSLSLNRWPVRETERMPENSPNLVVSIRVKSEQIAALPVCIR